MAGSLSRPIYPWHYAGCTFTVLWTEGGGEEEKRARACLEPRNYRTTEVCFNHYANCPSYVFKGIASLKSKEVIYMIGQNMGLEFRELLKSKFGIMEGKSRFSINKKPGSSWGL